MHQLRCTLHLLLVPYLFAVLYSCFSQTLVLLMMMRLATRPIGWQELNVMIINALLPQLDVRYDDICRTERTVLARARFSVQKNQKSCCGRRRSSTLTLIYAWSTDDWGGGGVQSSKRCSVSASGFPLLLRLVIVCWP